MNSVANARIWQETPFDQLYIQPSAGDGGGALGAALYTWHTILGNDRRFVMDHAYWGESYDDKSSAQRKLFCLNSIEAGKKRNIAIRIGN